MDFGLLKDRITGTVEYYKRTTSNLLLPVPFSYTSGLINPSTGGPTQNENVGSLENKGVELTLSARPVVTRDFTWTVSFNFSHNMNKVTSLYQGKPIPSTNGLFNYTVGHDLLTYYLRQWAGADPETGSQHRRVRCRRRRRTVFRTCVPAENPTVNVPDWLRQTYRANAAA